MKTIVVAGVLAFGGLMTTGLAVGHADEIQVEGNYPTQAACMADGPVVEVDHPGTWTISRVSSMPTASGTCN